MVSSVVAFGLAAESDVFNVVAEFLKKRAEIPVASGIERLRVLLMTVEAPSGDHCVSLSSCGARMYESH